MIKHLEKLLYEKTKDSQSEILFAQWNYDKKVIPTALNAVSSLFPHYSLHDETHSISIINNIVRVLGLDNIQKLSAIDLWLLLEASYSHDIGMVVTSEELTTSVKSSEFLDFFNNLIRDEKNGLHSFASEFEIIDSKIKYKSEYLNLEFHDGIKFILAEFFRRKHSERSKDILLDPSLKLSMASPRGVIPRRIFKILGDICASHTQNFDDVMTLPNCEVGIDVEDAHPRFISCLLRIGDLLDLDNNRFSEVMLRTLTKIPINTFNHKSKHLSIESFRIDREKIEVTARCETYDAANLTQHWFNYLNSEITNQMVNWNNIVPFKDLGYLPSIGNLQVVLDNYEYIDGKNKPKFKVDTDKALELLQGAGLYEGAYQCIREILQNAVDSTLIRIWLEHSGSKDFSSPQSSDFSKLVQLYPIIVTITEKGKSGDFKNWLIEIKDSGTGISGDDLKFLINTGSSSSNNHRISIIDSMPPWLKPSGTFGIGFQSIFMITDVVIIETKSFFDEKFQIVELNSPNSNKDGDILIQKRKTDHSIKPGAKILINHRTQAVPDRYTIKSEHRNANRIAGNYDPFSNDSLDIDLGKIVDELLIFSNKSPVPITLLIDNNEIETRSTTNKQFDFFEEENSLELNINIAKETRPLIRTYYKGQKAEYNGTIHFLQLEVNIHKDKASKVLTLNRNKIRPEYLTTFYNYFMYSVFKIITNNFESIFHDEEHQALASMFIHYYSEEESVKEFEIAQFNQWEKYKIPIEGGELSIGHIFATVEEIKLVFLKRSSDLESADKYVFNNKHLEITLNGNAPEYDFTEFILHKITSMFQCTRITELPNNKREIIFRKGKMVCPITKDYFNSIVLKRLRIGLSARRIIPCLDEFTSLRIIDDAFMPYVYHYRFDDLLDLRYPKMLSPWVGEEYGFWNYNLKVLLNDQVYDWVYENRYHPETTKTEIIEKYQEFIESFKIEIKADVNSDDTDPSCKF